MIQYFFIVLVLGVFCTLAEASSKKCDDVFSGSSDASESMADTSGFINFLKLSDANKTTQESAKAGDLPIKKTSSEKRQEALDRSSPEVRQFLGKNLREGITDLDLWTQAYLNNEPGSSGALSLIIQQGNDHNGNATWFRELHAVAKHINRLSSNELKRLSVKQQLQIYSLFSLWRVLPPLDFQSRLHNALSLNIQDWTEKNFKKFADMFAKTPMKRSEEFQKIYLSQVEEKFSGWRLSTQIEVLGAELIHGYGPSLVLLESMIEDVIVSVEQSTKPADRVKQTHLFRRMLHMRATEPTQLSSILWRLEKTIEFELNKSKASLMDLNETTEPNLVNANGDNFAQLEHRMLLNFPGVVRVAEYTDPSRPGFFDPVDSYWTFSGESEIFPLVLEKDGIQHYFIKMNADGKMVFGKEGLVLNPKDRAKDRSLRTSGVNVVRLTRYDQVDVENLDLLKLVREQNP